MTKKFSEVEKDFIEKTQEAMTNATLGGDPEFFISDNRGRVQGADSFLPGKYEPLVVDPVAGDVKSKLFFDGIQAEISFAHGTCREYIAKNIQLCLLKANDRIPKDHKFVIKPSTRVAKEVLENADPEARIFGCAPDFNAYTCSVNTPEMDASRHPYRYAGGHMHFGISSKYLDESDAEFLAARTEKGHLKTIKFLDLILGVTTLGLDNGPGSKRRREKYGKAGCFRPTPYGVEYRTPSCWWLSSPATVSLAFGIGRLAWHLLAKGLDERFLKLINYDEETVRGIVDEGDVKEAYKLWETMRPYIAQTSKRVTNPLHVCTMAYEPGFKDRAPRVIEDVKPEYVDTMVFGLPAFEYVLKNGISSIIDKDMRKEWRLSGNAPYPERAGFNMSARNSLLKNEDFFKFQKDFFKNKVMK